MSSYQQDQARDNIGRFASGGQGGSQARAERVALNQKLDARNRSLTFGFGPAARTMENKPAAHTAAIHTATAGKSLADRFPAAKYDSNMRPTQGPTLAQLSAMGATTFGGGKTP